MTVKSPKPKTKNGSCTRKYFLNNITKHLQARRYNLIHSQIKQFNSVISRTC